MSNATNAIWIKRATAVRTATTDHFNELVHLAALDPATDFRFADLSEVDFTKSNLRGFDFTGARLHGALFNEALIGPGQDADGFEALAARFDFAELGAVSHDGLPSLPLANIHAADDWNTYSRSWTISDQSLDREHLPIGAIFSDAPFAPTMVVIPPGRFHMGPPENMPLLEDDPSSPSILTQEAVEVTIAQPFAVSRFPVTEEERVLVSRAPSTSTIVARPDGTPATNVS